MHLLQVQHLIENYIQEKLLYLPSGHRRLKTSSGRLEKVTTSYDQTRRRQDVWRKTSDLRRLEDVGFTTSWRRLIYIVLKTSNLRCREDVQFGTSDLRRLEDIRFTSSWRHLIYDVLKTSVKGRLCSNIVATAIQRRKKWFFLIFYCLKFSENFKFSSLG